MSNFMETLTEVTSFAQFKYPFWMRVIRNLFRVASLFTALFLALSVMLTSGMSIVNVMVNLTLVISLYFYFRILRLLPSLESQSKVKIKKQLYLDLAQLFLFSFLIVFFYLVTGEKAEDEWNSVGHILRVITATPWLLFWLIYFSFSKNVKEFYIQNGETNSSFDWIFLIRYTFFIVIIIWGLFEIREYFQDRRGRLDVMLNLTLAGIHIFIISILRKTTKDIPSRVIFLLSIALSSYFVHHFTQYFFYSEELGEINYHLVQACLVLCWCGFWIFVFSKWKVVRDYYMG